MKYMVLLSLAFCSFNSFADSIITAEVDYKIRAYMSNSPQDIIDQTTESNNKAEDKAKEEALTKLKKACVNEDGDFQVGALDLLSTDIIFDVDTTTSMNWTATVVMSAQCGLNESWLGM